MELCDKPEFKRSEKFNYSAIASFIGEDIPPNTIKNYLKGDRVAQADMAIKISKAFNVSIDYLFGLSKSPNRDVNIASAAEYTGLSDAAVMALHNISSTEDVTHIVCLTVTD